MFVSAFQVCCNNPQYAPNTPAPPVSTTQNPFERPAPPPGRFTTPRQVIPTQAPTTTLPPPPPPPTTVAPTTSSPYTDECEDPNGIVGECKSIRECPVILEQFVARQNDQQYVQYIQRSNAVCNYVQPNVCRIKPRGEDLFQFRFI